MKTVYVFQIVWILWKFMSFLTNYIFVTKIYQKQRSKCFESGYFWRASNQQSLTGALPLLTRTWLLSFPPDKLRPVLVNLSRLGSPKRFMLMQTLVRTPDRHEPTATSGPLFKPSNRACLQVAGLQEPAKAHGRNCWGEMRSIHKLCTMLSLETRLGSLVSNFITT